LDLYRFDQKETLGLVGAVILKSEPLGNGGGWLNKVQNTIGVRKFTKLKILSIGFQSDGRNSKYISAVETKIFTVEILRMVAVRI
jgi:hypothetical protein